MSFPVRSGLYIIKGNNPNDAKVGLVKSFVANIDTENDNEVGDHIWKIINVMDGYNEIHIPAGVVKAAEIVGKEINDFRNKNLMREVVKRVPFEAIWVIISASAGVPSTL